MFGMYISDIWIKFECLGDFRTHQNKRFGLFGSSRCDENVRFGLFGSSRCDENKRFGVFGSSRCDENVRFDVFGSSRLAVRFRGKIYTLYIPLLVFSPTNRKSTLTLCSFKRCDEKKKEISAPDPREYPFFHSFDCSIYNRKKDTA